MNNKTLTEYENIQDCITFSYLIGTFIIIEKGVKD